MNQRKFSLSVRMTVCNHIARDLLSKICDIENDTKTSTDEKIEQMKKIRDEIMKVSDEIDNIKKEIKLISDCSIN